MSSVLDSNNLLDNVPFNSIRESILDWWRKNKRRYPWRNTTDPYKILMAEVLLHRTQANQVVPVFRKFGKRFPNIKTLAESSENEVLEILYPIGLHWRSKMLYSMANEIIIRFNGEIPQNFDELKSLPGISDYIASALRCFAFGYPDILLDTNTVRVSGRITGTEISDSSRRSKRFRYLLDHFIDTSRPKEFNWALIDFAALVCKSKVPLHDTCPLKNHCKSFSDK